MSVYFKAPSSLTPGTYSDTLQVSVCFDDRCQRPIEMVFATTTRTDRSKVGKRMANVKRHFCAEGRVGERRDG